MKKRDKSGYIKIKIPNHPRADKSGWVFEHIVVVEKFVNRYLSTEEVVHHINEKKWDNRIDNLMLFANQKEHMKFHTKIRQFGMTNSIKRQIAQRWDFLKS